MSYCYHCMNKLNDNDKFCSYCGKNNSAEIPAHHLLPGTTLNGKFTVGEALGEGGFGITYIGRDENLDMRVAIKEFFPSGFVNRTNTVTSQINEITSDERKDFFEKGKERFLNEARVLAKFSGEPGIVDVRDFFEENNTAYIIMEFLEGTDLKSYLKQNGTISPESVVNMLYPVMHSLKKVHAQGLIHRDISPDNIMVLNNTVKLLDFGAARSVSAESNKSLSVMLKPGYAPEEQYRSKGNQGPWTDVYAICATMYKCITGITPDDSAQRVYSDEVKTPSALGINISPVIENAIMRGMAVHQQDRYQNMDELIDAFSGKNVVSPVPGKTAAVLNTPVNVISDNTVTTHGDVTNGNVSAVNLRVEQHNKNNKKAVIITVSIVAALAVILAVVFAFIIPSLSDQDDIDKDGKEETTTLENVTQGAGEGESQSDGTSSETTAAPEEPSSSGNKGELALSDDPFDFIVEIEGDLYQFPCSVYDFIDNGWTVDSRYNDLETVLIGDSYDSLSIFKGKKSLDIQVYNLSGDSKKIKDCKVGGFEAYSFDDVDIVMAGNITLLSDDDEIQNAYGTPTDYSNYNGYSVCTYEEEYYVYVKFFVYSDSKSNSCIVRNFIKTDEDKTETKKDVPEYLSEYVAPDKLSNNIFSGILSIEGDIYCLPAPLSVFLDNGWTMQSKPGFVMSGNDEYINLIKDDKKISVTISNFAEYQTIPENCCVTRIDETVFYESDIAADIILSGNGKNITIGMSKDDMLSAFPEDHETYSGSEYDTYSYYDYEEDFSITIYVDKGTGLVNGIVYDYSTWHY